MSALRRWGEAHSEGGIELISRWGRLWSLSLWVDWTRFAIGFDVEREYGSRSWADRLHIALMLGPLTLSAVRAWNEPKP
jgi:hypothetical protein